jgi:lysophospholipase L1-like esterase
MKINIKALGFVALSFVLLFCLYNLLFGNKIMNVLNDKSINFGEGWENSQSLYAGSELNFIFINSKEITFELDTKSKADQGVEIFVDDKVYTLSSPNIESQKLSIKVDKNKPHTITMRHFCSYLYNPCQVALKAIFLDKGARLSPYQLHHKILSVFGDSISTMYEKNNYTQILAQDLGYELHNASIMGSTISRVKGADSASLRYRKDLMSFRSDIIILFLGTNDAGAQVSLDTFDKDYSKIIFDVKKYNPKGKIFLVGLLPRKDIDDNILENYNEIIKKIAESYQLTYVDSSSWLTENDFSDAIHPSLEGQKKIAERLKAVLSPFMK